MFRHSGGGGGGGGSGTVTATGGSLTANSVVLGAGTTDTKVVAGVTTDGTSALNLGVAGASVGKVVFANATSGTGTLQPPTGALGTITYTLPGVSATLATLGANTYTALQTITQASANAGILASTGYSLTGSDATGMVDLAGTWNTSGTPTALKLNITNTASNAASLLMDLQASSVSKIKATIGGAFTVQSLVVANGDITNPNGNYVVASGQLVYDAGKWALGQDIGLRLRSAYQVSWSSTSDYTSTDTFLTRGGIATLQQGAANAASPVAQTLQAQGSRSGTDTNVGGANYTIQSGQGTGTGTIASLIFKSPVAVASGTGAQTMTTGLTVKGGAYVDTVYTVATLPTGIQGMRATVTDSNAASYTAGIGAIVAAGGSTVVPVWYDGTNWRIG